MKPRVRRFLGFLAMACLLAGLLTGCSSGLSRVAGEWKLDPESSLNEYLLFKPMTSMEGRDALHQKLLELEPMLTLNISEEEIVFTHAGDPAASFRAQQSLVSGDDDDQKLQVECATEKGSVQLTYTLDEYGTLKVEHQGTPWKLRVGQGDFPFAALVWYKD